MPIIQRVFWVVACPSCKRALDFGDNGGYTVFKKRAQAEELWVDIKAGDRTLTLTEYCGCQRRKRKAARD